MRKFQIFRYLQQWKYIIVLTAILGCMAVIWYGNKNQVYTATAVIEYTNSAAAEGKNPDGSEIDKREITSAAVITDAISDLELDTNVEAIRSKFDVQEIIPKDEEEKRIAALDAGNEYEYYPTRYQVSFNVGTDSGKDYARDVLDTTLTNYFSWYCQKYVDYAVFSNNAANVTTDRYDYIDCVDMLYDAVEEIRKYLAQKEEDYPSFRSAKTGYSFADLNDCYKNIRDGLIARTYAYILNNQLVNNKELLVKRYQNKVAQYQLDIENYDSHIAEAKQLLDEFGNKTLEKNDLNYSFGGGNGSNEGLIIGNVEDWFTRNKGENNVETTYDKLIDQYVDLQNERIAVETKMNKANEILSVFDNEDIEDDTGSEMAQTAVADINEISAEMNELYEVILPTIDESNQRNGSDNLAMRSSISVREKFNMNTFIILAIIFFFALGCGGAILLGRIGDFVDYFLYTDKKTGLPNRNRCDIVIESYDRKILDDNFVCIVYKIELKFNKRPDYTRKDGDRMLHKMGQILKNIMQDETFVGYNNDGMFIAFVENCTLNKSEKITERVRELVDHYNANEAAHPIILDYGISQTTADNTYGIRDLLRMAIGRTFNKKKEQKDSQIENKSEEQDDA